MNPRDAEAALRKALELDRRDVGARMELGAFYEDQGKFAQAAAELERAIVIDPEQGGAHRQLGRICRRQGRLSEAEAALRQALELDTQDIGARIELGALYEDQGKFAQAAAEFERAVAIDPNNGGAHCQLGRICRRQGRWSEAEAALRRALELEPQNGWARFELGALCQAHVESGALYEEQGKFIEAAAEFEKAIAIDPGQGKAHCQLGRICRRQGRLPEAAAALHKALERDPQDGGARFEMGALYEDQNRVVEAVAEFERAIAIDPNMAGAHSQLGRMYRRQGRASEAEAALRQALEFDPQDGRARFELGALCQDQDRIPEAAVEFEKAIAIDPHNVDAHRCLGQCHLRRGQWAEAEAEFHRAASLNPRHDGAYIGLWAVYRGQGRAAEAEAALAQALAIAPTSAFDGTELLYRLDRDKAVGDSAKEQMRERVFCLMPWTHLHVRADGVSRPCGAWSGLPLGNARASSLAELWNSPGMRSMRSDMMSGRPVKGCWGCYYKEQSGILSMRQINNIAWDRHRGRARLTAPDGTLPQRPVPWLDIRFSNACNLRCRTCDPTQSSAWAADAQALGLPVEGGPLQKPCGDGDSLWRQLQPLLEDGVEMIHFIGGEPLLMEEHYRMLDFLIARGRTDVRLRYNTNFSTLRFQGRDVVGQWSRFRDVKVAASLDGSGRRGEYLRKGLSWEAVVANREEMLRRCPEVDFSIFATLSIFNALHLPDFHREWVEKGFVKRDKFALNILRDPEIYRMQVLPAALKERVLEAYRRHQESFLDADGAAARDFAAAAHLLQAQDCSELLPGFVAMTRRLDQLRGEDCREVFPELAALFEVAA